MKVMESEGDEEHAAQDSEARGALGGGWTRAALRAACLSFFFARLQHINLQWFDIDTLLDLISTGRTHMLSQPLSSFVRRAPEHGSSWPPYRRSLVGRAIFISLTMFVAAAPPRARRSLGSLDYSFAFISHWSHFIVLHNLLLRSGL
jgi:hypothetical protein